MSMNLKAAEVELWQTPTWVTYICYSNNDGGWKGVLYRYEQWAKSRYQGISFEKKEELDDLIEVVKLHLERVHAAAKKHKKLTFTIE